jgi:hypothetical protein
MREDLDFFLTKVKLAPYVYRANIVLTFSFPEKFGCCRSYFLVSTVSFPEKTCLFLFPEKFIPNPVTRKSRPMYSSAMVDEACVIFLSFSGGWKRSSFFICR